MKILILNGPNLNLLGRREPEIYGSQTFEAYLEELKAKFREVDFSYFQSNVEGELINFLQTTRKGEYAGIVLNAAAYTHTSVALADTVRALSTPVIEVHISNVFRRESFRHHSFLSPYVNGIIVGFGLKSYELAIQSLLDG